MNLICSSIYKQAVFNKYNANFFSSINKHAHDLTNDSNIYKENVCFNNSLNDSFKHQRLHKQINFPKDRHHKLTFVFSINIRTEKSVRNHHQSLTFVSKRLLINRQKSSTHQISYDFEHFVVSLFHYFIISLFHCFVVSSFRQQAKRTHHFLFKLNNNLTLHLLQKIVFFIKENFHSLILYCSFVLTFPLN